MRRVSRSRRSSPNVVSALVLVAAVGMVAVAGAGCGRTGASATRPARAFDFGPFAGYTQIGPAVRSVSATLTVPRVSSRDNGDPASTWIGAEAVGPDGQFEPFIQVGVGEMAGDWTGSGLLPPSYEAFWTDAERGDHGYALFTVHPGDRVLASITLSHRHWILSIVDGAVHRRVITTEEAGAEFQQALWIQEHPAAGDEFLPYPKVTGLRISDLLVNGTAPSRRDLSPAWMSVRDVVFEPTALGRDAFTLLPGRASVPAAMVRILLKLEPGADDIWNPQLELADATTRTPRVTVARWASQLSNALIALSDAMRQQQWSRNAQASVNTLLNALKAQLSLTRQVAHLRTSQFTGWQARWSASATTSLIAEASMLHAVRLPWAALPTS
jgi:Peptidase A4 family